MSHLKGVLDDAPAGDKSLSAFHTYEDYLDSQITELDHKYLQDEELARQLVELGYHGTGETLKRAQFEKKKAEELKKDKKESAAPKQLFSAGLTFGPDRPFLAALAAREEAVTQGKLTCIIFIRHRNAKGQEISGYIDFAHRLKTEDFGVYFRSRDKDLKKEPEKLLPKPSDLSYYNWDTQTSTCNSTANFVVSADSEQGLLFKNRRDRKVINVDPKAHSPGDNSKRIPIKTNEYIQVVLYDHTTRRGGMG